MFKLFARFASSRGPQAGALAALERGDFEAAESALSELLAAHEPDASSRAFLLNKRGVARIGAGRRKDAAGDFTAALELAPRYAPALSNLGNLALEDGDLQTAVARYEAAIAADVDYAPAYLNLAVALRRAGRIAESVRALRTSMRLEGRRGWKQSKRP